ncbi:hypothetical protein E2562_027144 [Oryza meyeriana var. granulata]|uniref:Uncharacterized protein n=1 Tax=Oryza meyeriana var. granulata TaxID=110450 RepID=A0A6G1EQ10_9ORYZ|nr:hypothetical protein E2562_027144 [Oryza meyeriana var. granulata]
MTTTISLGRRLAWPARKQGHVVMWRQFRQRRLSGGDGLGRQARDGFGDDAVKSPSSVSCTQHAVSQII